MPSRSVSASRDRFTRRGDALLKILHSCLLPGLLLLLPGCSQTPRPGDDDVTERTSPLLNACGAAGTVSVELAQPSSDLCAPHHSRGAANFNKRECLYDLNDTSGTDATLDGDIDTCANPDVTWHAADISDLTTASGTPYRYWAISDEGDKGRKRCDGSCNSTDEDVPDPVGDDCVEGRTMNNSKWLGRAEAGTVAVHVAVDAPAAGGHARRPARTPPTSPIPT